MTKKAMTMARKNDRENTIIKKEFIWLILKFYGRCCWLPLLNGGWTLMLGIRGLGKAGIVGTCPAFCLVFNTM